MASYMPRFYARAQNYEKRLIISLWLSVSVCLSVRPHGTTQIFMKFFY